MTYKEPEDNNSYPVDWEKLVGEQARRLQLEKDAKKGIEKESDDKAVRFLQEIGANELLTQIRDQVWKAGSVIPVFPGSKIYKPGFMETFWWAYKSKEELGLIPKNWWKNDYIYRKQAREMKGPFGEAGIALCLAWEEKAMFIRSNPDPEERAEEGIKIVQADDPIVIRCAYLGIENNYALGVARGGRKKYLNDNIGYLPVSRITTFGVVPDFDRQEVGLTGTFFVPEESNPRKKLIEELVKKILPNEDYSRVKETEVHSFSPIIELYE